MQVLQLQAWRASPVTTGMACVRAFVRELMHELFGGIQRTFSSKRTATDGSNKPAFVRYLQRKERRPIVFSVQA